MYQMQINCDTLADRRDRGRGNGGAAAAELKARRRYGFDAGVLPPCTPSAPPVPSPPLTVCAL